MTRFKIHGAFLGAAALLASVLAGPTMAQQTIATAMRCSNANPDARCQAMGSDTAYRHHIYRRDRDWQNPGWQDSYNRVDPGPFGPVDAAAGVVGGAVGTAAAIATAPFGGPDYARTPIGGEEYARQNGFVCTPGTWFRGGDGLRHPCQ
ncbi:MULTISPECIES: hypothetical protein [unclassified Bradyrhizobium]|uniref:hypothetical protein n=1 Tax=unclassified Bradyrhizobium TaxID=2631580 RepID=UPI001BAB7FC3|nr:MULTISPECIES: hypothetical protein [unclassified Bradyrhizobium]MBR1204464.1 hypothetical protein [Bradyrhizobium sp. AUGA SZCCT0124]MBR1309650.1 hypothetical protein [Bradyrhizobium sp. AUGA SZCCT0051]MBR1339791.1 hypothetical protein [Bradyrhizobium sp. AUGA SZCCT0105]MBR1354398.1 hypothetical protein [Bradyrhizobium sp. AUGA SZCCT0045]